MSKYLRGVARKVSEDLCGVSVYGDDALDIEDTKFLARDYLKITANRDFGWLPPMKAGFIKWQCTVCKSKYILYNNAYNCCVSK